MKIKFSLFMVSALVASNIVYATQPNWSEWDKANSIAKSGLWLVIRQPDDGFCYIKQGYEGASKKMDLAMKKDNAPYLTTPFYRGIEGDVTYQVDQGALRIVTESNASAFGIKLSSDVVSELKKGSKLKVRVKPKGEATIEQVFNLKGFTGAAKWLGSEDCRKRVADRYN